MFLLGQGHAGVKPSFAGFGQTPPGGRCYLIGRASSGRVDRLQTAILSIIEFI